MRMGKKKGRRHAEEGALESEMRRIDEAAGAIAEFYRRGGEEPPVYLVAVMAVALDQAQKRDARAALEKGDAPKEGESFVLAYNVLNEVDAYLDANPEVARYANYLAHVQRDCPAWIDGRPAEGGKAGAGKPSCWAL